MANVDLGTFTFDAKTVDKQIADLTNKLYELKTETKGYSDEVRENDKELKKLAETQKLLANGTGKNKDALKATADRIKELNVRQKELFVSQKKVSEVQKVTNAF